MPCLDPYYQDVHRPAGWIRQQAEGRGVCIEVDSDLTSPGYVSRDGHRITARPGLSVPTFHWLVACGVIAHLFGIETAPDLPLAPDSRDANVIPLRGPAFTFWENRNRFSR